MEVSRQTAVWELFSTDLSTVNYGKVCVARASNSASVVGVCVFCQFRRAARDCRQVSYRPIFEKICVSRFVNA